MKIFDFKKILRYFTREKAWQIIVVAFIVFLAILIFANLYVFWSLEKEANQSVANEIKSQTLNRGLLDKILSDLQQREKQFEQNGSVKPSVSDPAL